MVVHFTAHPDPKPTPSGFVIKDRYGNELRMLADDCILKTAEAARLLGVSASYLYKDRKREAPSVPFFCVGGAIRYRVGDLKAYIARNTHGQ